MSLIRQLAASEGQAGSRGQVKGGKVNDDDDNNNNINIIIKNTARDSSSYNSTTQWASIIPLPIFKIPLMPN
jgi:hypothetical protein